MVMSSDRGGAGEEGADGERGFGLAHEDAGGDVGGLGAACAHRPLHDPGDPADDDLHEADVIHDGEECGDEDDGGQDGKGEDGEGIAGCAERAEDERGAVDGVAEQTEVMTFETAWRMRWPVLHLMTRKAKRIWRLRPQMTVRQRMARRLVEKA